MLCSCCRARVLPVLQVRTGLHGAPTLEKTAEEDGKRRERRTREE